MARSSTSRVSSAAEKAQWKRRPGSPGGPRSEAQKLGHAAPTPPTPLAEREVTEEIVLAWRNRDKERLREILGLQVWQPGPWSSAPCDAPAGHRPGMHGSCSCGALVLRARILAALDAEDGETSTNHPNTRRTQS